MLACPLLLEGMKRFVFISRFSIAAGLTGAVTAVHFFCVRLHMLTCTCVCLLVYVNGCMHTVRPLHLCVHVCVSPQAWYHPERNSLVESSYQSHVRGGEEERVRGDDK